MSMKYTPGPWSQSHRKRPDGMYSTEVYCVDGHTIASCAWYPRPADPTTGAIGTYREANAHLIAAAPDGFELAEEFLAFALSGASFSYPPGSLQKLEQYIAKARGEQP